MMLSRILKSRLSDFHNGKKYRGFTLVELLVSLTLGLIVTAAVVRVYQSNGKLQQYNYALSTIQQDGRYIITGLRQSLAPVSMYNEFSANLHRGAADGSIDIEMEGRYIRSNPIVKVGDYDQEATLGAVEGGGSASDRLVINLMAVEGCNGSDLGYGGRDFHVVNEYFVDGTTLRCKGHDGRYLRGLKDKDKENRSEALLENVHQFQVLYGISQPTNGVETGFVTSWVSADRLPVFVTDEGILPVVGVKLAILIKNDDDIYMDNKRDLKLLGHASFTPETDGLYRVFETVVIFRNAWNNLTVGG